MLGSRWGLRLVGILLFLGMLAPFIVLLPVGFLAKDYLIQNWILLCFVTIVLYGLSRGLLGLLVDRLVDSGNTSSEIQRLYQAPASIWSPVRLLRLLFLLTAREDRGAGFKNKSG